MKQGHMVLQGLRPLPGTGWKLWDGLDGSRADGPLPSVGFLRRLRPDGVERRQSAFCHLKIKADISALISTSCFFMCRL
jgi:hypothetical protein